MYAKLLVLALALGIAGGVGPSLLLDFLERRGAFQFRQNNVCAIHMNKTCPCGAGPNPDGEATHCWLCGVPLNQNADALRNHSSNVERSLPERPHLRFESMMREIASHPKELAVIADKKSLPDRLRLLAEIHLWQELGEPSQEVWLAAFYSSDFQSSLKSLDQASLYGMFGFEDREGRCCVRQNVELSHPNP